MDRMNDITNKETALHAEGQGETSTSDYTNLPIKATLFPDLRGANCEPYSGTYRELVAFIRDIGNNPADHPEFVKQSKGELPLFSLAAFGGQRNEKGCLRHNANVLEIYGIVGDYDGPRNGGAPIDMMEAQTLLHDQGITALIYASPFHLREKARPGGGVEPAWPRYRIVAPCSKAHEPAVYQALVAKLNGVFKGQLDPASFTLSQAYYIGMVVGSKFEVVETNGRPIDLVGGLTMLGKDGKPLSSSRPVEGFEEGAGLVSGYGFAPSLGAAAYLLSKLDPSMPHPDWWKVAKALRDGLGGDGWPMFHSWSMGGGDSYKGEADCRAVWDTEKAPEHMGIDLALVRWPTLVHMAKAACEARGEKFEGYCEPVEIDIEGLIDERLAQAERERRHDEMRVTLGLDVRHGTKDTHPLTAQGNALRLLDLYGERIRYVPEDARFMAFQGGAWVGSKDGAEVRSLVRSLPDVIYAEGAQLSDPQDRATIAQWALQSQSQRVVDDTMKALADIQRLRASITLWDSDLMLVGLDGGRKVIDLRTGTVRLVAPPDLVTKSLGCRALGDAKECVRWRRFLNEVFPGDFELVAWMKRLLGYCLTGTTTEHKMPFFFGYGANGKSTLLETVLKIMGDYGKTTPVESLMIARNAGGGATPELASLPGYRLIVANETQSGQELNEGLVKQMTGSDTIAARPLYGSPFTFKPQFKLLMAGNHAPIIKGTDHGIWRRLDLVPFAQQFDGGRADKNLAKELEREAPHILAWMVEGCLEWQRDGAGHAKTIAAATSRYRREQDTIQDFIEERLELGAGHFEPSEAILHEANAWARTNNYKEFSRQGLSRRLVEKGIGIRAEKRRIGGRPTNCLVGVKIRAD